MIKGILFILLTIFCTIEVWGNDGDVFTAKTVEGVEMTFKVISETDKTCQVGRLTEWAINGNSISQEYDGNITIPSYVNDYHVIRIGRAAFDHCNLKSIVIPSDIYSIFNEAFNCCFNLESVSITNGLEIINSLAFNYCTSLKSIDIPQSVQYIGEEAFRYCTSLSSITIPSNVSTIAKSKSSGITIFEGCNLNSIKVDEGNSIYDSRDNCNAIIETETNKLLVGCKRTVIPKSVISIDSYAFSHCTGLSSFTIPSNVTSIGRNAFSDCTNMTTIDIPVSVGNPNLLLYVKSASYAPATIKNVIVNNVADNITLTDAASGNNFYCPQEFTAKSISYTHHYGMITGIGESRGWETIALPFDVQKITHSSKGEIIPFVNWKSGDSKKPFWLMELGTSGFVDASAIKANTPYIISMPNHTNYKNEFRLNGNIAFSAQNVKVKASNNLQSTSSGDKTFHPNYVVLENTNAYALNVNNDYVSYSGGSKEGSTFVLNLRKLHPFEAYMTSTSKARQTIAIQDNLTTGIRDVAEIWDDKIIRVYNLSGQLLMIEENKSLKEIKQMLSAGVYIVNGKKLIVR